MLPPAYKVIRHEKLDITQSQIIKTHYRKNRRGEKDFKNLVDSFLQGLEAEPRVAGAVQEPQPSRKCLPEGCEFWKMKWRPLPGLYGQAAFGRLMYLIFEDKKIVVPFWIYTHAEYGKPKSRPPSEDILKEMKKIISYVQELSD
jgi:hypothetical protein